MEIVIRKLIEVNLYCFLHFYTLIVRNDRNDSHIVTFKTYCAATVQHVVPKIRFGTEKKSILHHQKLIVVRDILRLPRFCFIFDVKNEANISFLFVLSWIHHLQLLRMSLCSTYRSSVDSRPKYLFCNIENIIIVVKCGLACPHSVPAKHLMISSVAW